VFCAIWIVTGADAALPPELAVLTALALAEPEPSLLAQAVRVPASVATTDTATKTRPKGLTVDMALHRFVDRSGTGARDGGRC
jgi:hypothetical protein